MIDEQDMKRLDDRYVTKDECNTKLVKTQGDIAEMNVAIRELTVKVSHLLKLVATIGSAALVPLVGMAVKIVFGG